MGNSESSLEDGLLSAEHLSVSETLGYRVLGVQPNSPASSAGLVSFLDFLVGCEEQMLLSNDDDVPDVDFVQLLKDAVGKQLELLVYNIKSQNTRLVHMTPQRDWGGKGLIGVTIRLDDYAVADERLLRVLDVEPTSPADVAGMIPLSDYLLGTSTVSFSSDTVLASTLAQYQERPLEIYVYNTESDTVRMVTLLPTYEWGAGDGLLGAEVGMGYLHRFPEACRSTDGVSAEINVVRTLAPRRPQGDNSDGEDDDEPVEEEIIDLTLEDRDVGQMQGIETSKLPTHESTSSKKETTDTPHLVPEADMMHQLRLAPSSVPTLTQTPNVKVRRQSETSINSPAAADFFAMNQPPSTTTAAVDLSTTTDATNTNNNNNNNNDGSAPFTFVAVAPNPFRMKFPVVPFRSGIYSPPVSATGFNGADSGVSFPPPPISNVDVGATTNIVNITKMPPPPMISNHSKDVFNRQQEIDLR